MISIYAEASRSIEEAGSAKAYDRMGKKSRFHQLHRDF